MIMQCSDNFRKDLVDRAFHRETQGPSYVTGSQVRYIMRTGMFIKIIKQLAFCVAGQQHINKLDFSFNLFPSSVHIFATDVGLSPCCHILPLQAHEL